MSELTATAFAGQHALQSLPFDPRSLSRLSERLIVSHHENNYGGAVRNLNGVEKQLAQVTFFANIQWNVVNQRFEQARAVHRAWAS